MPLLAQESGGGLGGIIVVLILIAVGYAGYRIYQASKQETSESRTVEALPPSIQHVVANMDAESQNAFFNEYEGKKKKKSVGWIAWLLIGWHYLYAGKVGLQFAFWFTLGGFGIWWLVDLFRMPSIIRSANEQIARNAIQTLGTAAAFGKHAGTIGATVAPTSQIPGSDSVAIDPPPAPESRDEEKLSDASDKPSQPPEGDVTYCVRCGTANPAGFKFCRSCGSPAEG